MEEKILKTVEKYKLIEEGDIVIVGLSGGADSVSLLLSLNALKCKLKIKKLIACHINHNLRDTAQRDCDFSRALCDSLGIDFYEKQADIKKKMEELKIGCEEAGRLVRYEFFHEIKEKTGATKIATAHNLDDQIETFFIRLLRGSSLDGLTSIKPFREDGVIRPLIEVERKEIEEYLRNKNQDFVTDETNLETEFMRNKVRLMLLPYLRENFSFKNEVIINTLELIKRDCEHFQGEVDKILAKGEVSERGIEFPLEVLNNTDDAVFSRVIKEAAKRYFGIELTKTKLDRACQLLRQHKALKKAELKGDVYATVSYGRFIIEKKDIINKYTYSLNMGDNPVKELGIIIKLTRREDASDKGIYISSTKGLKVRNRENGDRVYIKKVGHKKVKDIFIDKKIPQQKRAHYPMILQGDEIIWIPGLYKNEEKDGKYCLSVRRMENEKSGC